MTKELKCRICGNAGEKIDECNGYYFCNNCYGKGTIILGLMNWKSKNPDYIHPKIGEYTADMSFDELLNLYDENVKKK